MVTEYRKFKVHNIPNGKASKEKNVNRQPMIEHLNIYQMEWYFGAHRVG